MDHAMFGYVVPLKPELKMKDYAVYKGYYCGLCKRIHRSYSFFSRFFLNYDCAFLSLLFSSLSPEAPVVRREACVINPFLKKQVVHAPESEYAAALNILFAYGKIRDNAVDDRDVFCYILKGLFTGLRKRSSKRCPQAAQAVAERLERLSRLEKAREPSLDKPAHEFACLLGDVLQTAPFDWLDEGRRDALYRLGYNLGRYVYLLDAFDDLESDIRKKRYNPLALRFSYAGGPPDAFRRDIRKDMEFNLYYTLSEAAKAYESLNIEKNRALLDNIIYLGLQGKAADVLEGRTQHGSL